MTAGQAVQLVYPHRLLPADPGHNDPFPDPAALCERWHVFRGTPVRFWLEAELAGIFGVTTRPSAETADLIYDEVVAVTETAGFSRISVFVDDTRAFCSILARHDMWRRVSAGVLARLVAEHRLSEEETTETAVDLVPGQPTTVFRL